MENLYVNITSGEENYYFTKDEAIKLLSWEFDRVAKEGRRDELGFQWDFVWLTEEDYAEMSNDPDKPTFN